MVCEIGYDELRCNQLERVSVLLGQYECYNMVNIENEKLVKKTNDFAIVSIISAIVNRRKHSMF